MGAKAKLVLFAYGWKLIFITKSLAFITRFKATRKWSIGRAAMGRRIQLRLFPGFAVRNSTAHNGKIKSLVLLHLLRHDAYTLLLMLKLCLLIANQILDFCYSYDQDEI